MANVTTESGSNCFLAPAIYRLLYYCPVPGCRAQLMGAIIPVVNRCSAPQHCTMVSLSHTLIIDAVSDTGIGKKLWIDRRKHLCCVAKRESSEFTAIQ